MELSVVIPVYNAESFIHKSYNSIIAQQITDLEIIYVDNNSIDNSVQEIKKLIKEDNRVSLYTASKQGAAPARNKGIEKSKGDYIYLFDVDDEIFPNVLQQMVKVLDQEKSLEAVFGKMVKSSKGIIETAKPSDETFEVLKYEKPYWGLKWFEDLKTVVGPPAFLYRRGVFDKIGFYNEDLKIGQDTALDIKLGMTCDIAFIDAYVYLYYKHSNSTLEQSKKEKDQVYNLWERLVKSHFPFYLKNEVPYKYKELLFKQLFSSMGKLVARTKGFKNRRQMRHKVLSDSKSIEISIVIKAYLMLLELLPLKILEKIYVYKVSQYYAKLYLKKLKVSFDLMKFLKHIIRKLLLNVLYSKYVVANALIKEDVKQNLILRGSKAVEYSEKIQFYHMMLYYQEYAMLFFWRISKAEHPWRKWFTKDFNCKLFASSKIAGGLACYHPFATVINAKSIGRNFVFRNGLTIGNKNNDNGLLPVIGHNVEVGANVVIIGNIVIGDNVIIGAGSVVVKDIPSNSIVAGNPAKVIKEII